jgi:uncharacterized FAD-dependent dehydrogenase
MSSNTRVFIVNNIKLPIDASPEEAFSVSKKRLSRLNVNTLGASFSIYRRSIDARKKDNILFVYSISVSGIFSRISENKLKDADISVLDSPDEISVKPGTEASFHPPLVVGSGPCGLFSALLLAENGYKPTLIERGGDISDRVKQVNKFKREQILNTNTNIQFGAGGAGTFSDGKLVTRINDPLSSYVLRRLVDFGAPEEILYIAKPHIGTDILSGIVSKILLRIEELGGTVLYNTQYFRSKKVNGTCYAETSMGDIPYSALILAIGHSARDTYKSLIQSGFTVEAKPFSVGMRIEHRAEDIDKALYGKFASHPALGHAEYNLSHNTKERGVYTFCMCPGGEVVAAASEEYGVVVNGMSVHSRSGTNSNSAVVCSIFKEDYGSTPMQAIEFQRKIEHAAFEAGGSDYSAPIITVGDFLNDKCITEPKYITPTYMDSLHTKLASPSSFLPDFVCNSIKNAIFNFDTKIKGFARIDAVLTGAETRTSAPVRILRDSSSRLAIGNDNIYPAGEGAGYAGGITSAAIDGLKTAIAVIERFKPYIGG